MAIIHKCLRFEPNQQEHNNDHQLDLAQAVERRGWGRMVLDIDDLDALCAQPPPAHRAYAPAKVPLLGAVRDAIKREGERTREPRTKSI